MLSNEIIQFLARLRSHIRLYVAGESAAWTVAMIVAFFWLTLGLDFVFEMGWGVRILLLVLAVGALCAHSAIHAVPRLVLPLPPSSLALTLERLVPGLGDRLITAVELQTATHAGESAFSPVLVAETVQSAEESIRKVALGGLLNHARLRKTAGVAGLCVFSWVAFVFASPKAANVWFQRNILLDPEVQWPHRTSLQVLGFPENRKKVARGDPLEIRALASGQIPRRVQIRYRMEKSGTRNRAYFKQTGETEFVFQFQGLLEPVEFMVSGGDDSAGPFFIETVAPPAVHELLITCWYPDYTGLSPSTTVANALLYSFPYGTNLTLTAKSNKELSRVRWTHNAEILEGPPSSPLEFNLGLDLVADISLKLALVDRDGIENKEALSLSLLARPDQPPSIEAELRGIRPAITSTAVVPTRGTAKDEFGVRKIEFRYQVDAQPAQTVPFEGPAQNQQELAFEERFDVSGLELKPGQKIQMAVVAEDGDVLKGPKVGSSALFHFAIVTPDELLSKIAARELNLRRRFERALSETRQTKDDLSLVATAKDKSEATRNMLKLYVEKAQLASRKNLNEVAGILESFQDILLELQNNRINLPDLLARIEEGVCIPLTDITTNAFPELERELQALANKLDKGEESSVEAGHADQAADMLVRKMEKVLQAMMSIESFNEAIEMLRGILNLQEKVEKETKELRKQKIKALLD